jgi:molybdenum cofactor cytidylyltransferase
MIQDPPVLETWVPVAGIVFADTGPNPDGAAGPKTPWSFANRAVRAATAALDAGLDPVIAVLGHEAETVAQELKGLPLLLVTNPASGPKRSVSIRQAIDVLPRRTGAVLFLPVDSPLTTSDTISTIVRTHRRSLAPACRSALEGEGAGPALFDKTLFDELRELQGDEDERFLLEKHRESVAVAPIGAPRGPQAL